MPESVNMFLWLLFTEKNPKFENVKTQENITWCLDEINSEANTYTMK